MENIFFDIGIIIIIATIFGYFSKLIRQPLIPAYIIAGILIGPNLLALVADRGLIQNLAEIGIAFLLFMVGLELDFKRLKSISKVGTIGGSLKTIILFGSGFLIALSFGVSSREALFLAFALCTTSTMVIVKLLSDKGELDTLHGRIVLGFLVMEDILQIFFLGFFSPQGLQFPMIALIQAGVALGFLYILSKAVFPNLFRFGAAYSELLVLLSLSVCFLFAMVSNSFGLSIAIGAYLGGVSLANLPYNWEISSRIKPLRDFFSVIFFVTLGMELGAINLPDFAMPLIILLIFLFLIRPVITFMVITFFGYSVRTSFLSAISLICIDEFSLIIVTGGYLTHQISERVFTLIILLAIISFILTSYLIEFDRKIFSFLERHLRKAFPHQPTQDLNLPEENKDYNVVLVGYERTGFSIVKKLHTLNKKLLVIDYNPEVIHRLQAEGIHCMYGDVSQVELLDRLDFKHVELVISTAHDPTDNMVLIKKVKSKSHSTAIFVTSYQPEDALELYEAGADYVILPHYIGGDHVALILEEMTPNINKLLERKLHHIEELRQRHHHEHPHKG